jgi:hypothetical protein
LNIEAPLIADSTNAEQLFESSGQLVESSSPAVLDGQLLKVSGREQQ